jgi:type III restriction enzyme
MSERYGHKDYQNKTLESLARYLRRCRELNDPERAFLEVTSELWGMGHPYNKVHRLGNGAEMPQDMPFVCLRVPTGGGKTVIGARAVKVVRDELLETDFPLVLWLVPSDAIRVQTLNVMRDRSHPLAQILVEELGTVEILDGEAALSLKPATLNGGAVIIVATIQSFRVEKMEGRKVYGNSGQLMEHFDFIPQEVKNQFPRGFPHSLANVLRLRRPLVVVDEAHNVRTDTSMETLERFQPRAVLELTATPETDAKENPSNVLHSVSAAELKAENMIKLPIVLEALTGFKEVVASAVAMRGELEKEAEAERAATGENIRPILLLQAEPHDKDRPDALTVEVVEKALREDHFIPEAQIAVATGKERGLEGVDLNKADCPIRYVITQSALKEGWDCPFAYVLCSVANLHSATAVEQILGRILRMPRAERKTRPALNRAYAFVCSPHFFVAAEMLRDQLVKSAGFDRREAREFFVPSARQESMVLDARGRRSVTVTLPEVLLLEKLPAAARDCVTKHDPEKREVTLTGRPTKAAIEALVAAVEKEESKEILRAAAVDLAQHERIMVAPAERGERFEIPQMMLEFEGRIVSPDEAEWLEAGWHLPLPPEPEDSPTLEASQPSESVGIVDVEDGKVITRRMPELAKELQLIEVRENWTQTRLVAWLDRNIPHVDIAPDESNAYLDAVLTGLQAALPLGRLVKERFELRRKIEARIDALRKAARRREYQRVLFGDESRTQVRVGGSHVFAYDPHTYPCRMVCPRSKEFVKHYYEQVGELDDEQNREEFRCAQLLDGLGGVEWWVRNLERQPVHSFWLQTSTDKFYPDFVCKLKNGKILVVEYKGSDRATNDDTKEKERLGELWEARSGGRCLFRMVKGPAELPKISEAVAATTRAQERSAPLLVLHAD